MSKQLTLNHIAPQAKLDDWGSIPSRKDKKQVQVLDTLTHEKAQRAEVVYKTQNFPAMLNFIRSKGEGEKDFLCEQLFKIFVRPKSDFNAKTLMVSRSMSITLQLLANDLGRKPAQSSKNYRPYAQKLVSFHYHLMRAVDCKVVGYIAEDWHDIKLEELEPLPLVGVSKHLCYATLFMDYGYFNHCMKVTNFRAGTCLVHENGVFDKKFFVKFDYDKHHFHHLFKMGSTVLDVMNWIEFELRTFTQNRKQTGHHEPLPSVSIWSRKGSGQYMLAFDKDPLKRWLVTGTLDEMQRYKKCQPNSDEYTFLFQKWQEIKQERLSINHLHLKNDEMKNTPAQRDTDVTPEMMGVKFGLRGIEFGNWVKQGKGYHDRQDFINKVYDGFADLALFMSCDFKTIGLDNTLGLAMGSRGRGSAVAHYEPDNRAINLTKTRGNGSLAHEWWHALDHHLGIKLGHGKNLSEFHFQKLMKIPSFKAMSERSAKLDLMRGSDYFNTPRELSARFFECMITYLLEQKGHFNHFLVSYNRTPECVSLQTYPYLRDEERTSQDFHDFVKILLIDG